jgi:plastocyanin
MKRIMLAALCLIFAGSVIAEDESNNGGTITGTIKVRRLRDSRDVVVYLQKVGEQSGPQAPSREAAVTDAPSMDQENLVFVPHVLPVVVGPTVRFPNSDQVRHNVFSPTVCKKFNLGTYAAGEVREVTFDTACVVNVLCNVHSEMSAFIVVLENDYFAVTGPDGIFAIENVPAGTYEIKTWHEKLREKKQEVEVADGKTVTVDFQLSR